MYAVTSDHHAIDLSHKLLHWLTLCVCVCVCVWQVAVGHTDGSGSIVSPARGDILTAFEPLPTSPSGQELGGHGAVIPLPHTLGTNSGTLILRHPTPHSRAHTHTDLWKFRNRQLGVRVKDLETCLDTLQWWNSDSDSPFYGPALSLSLSKHSSPSSIRVAPASYRVPLYLSVQMRWTWKE
jgi:hypothetical protein